MKNKNIIQFSLICLITGLLMVSCVNSTNSNTSLDTLSSEKGEIDMIEKISYKDLYHHTYKKSDILSGINNYKASDGYIESNSQGYNGFYYQSLVNENYQNLNYKENAWVDGDVRIENDLMTSSSTKCAVRKFVSPTSGKAKIQSTIKLIKGNKGYIEIKQNDFLVAHIDISNKNKIYSESDANINKNDAIYFILHGDITISYNPYINFKANDYRKLHHAVDGYYGDVHPFYNIKEKKMYMYYLNTGLHKENPPVVQFQTSLTSSFDMMHYEKDICQIDEVERPEQDLYFALNIFKGKDGVYRSHVGAGDHASCSKTDDFHVWKNGAIPYIDEKDDLFKYKFSVYFDQDVKGARDPDTFYDSETESYYTVILSYNTQAMANGKKNIAMYIGDGQGRYSTKSYKLLDLTNRGDGECPQIKKINHRWYIFYSVYGTGTSGNVGKYAYRIGDENTLPQNVNWDEKEEFYLNGEDLHAAQVTQVGDKYYLYGWLNYKFNSNVWGGYLNTPIELYQEEDGTLKTRLDEMYLELANKGEILHLDEIKSNIGIPNTYSRPYLTFDLSQINKGNDYITIKDKNTYLIGIENINNEKYLVIKCDALGYKVTLKVNNTNNYKFNILIDDEFVDVNVNDEYTLSAITNLSSNPKTISTTLNSGSIIKDFKINKLANLDNFYF